MQRSSWLPITKKDADSRGWDELDVVLVSGDAYVDHPSFGTALIARVLEDEQLRVAIIAQPNWRDDLRDFKKFGRPRLFFGVSSGCMDSMVSHYTANRRRRSKDAYTPGGETGFRPDRALSVYCDILKSIYPDCPIVAGGVEGSLRRLTHYDYWDDSLKPSILEQCAADLLVYGEGEVPLREIVRLLKKGVPFSKVNTVSHTAFIPPRDSELPKNKNWTDFELHSHARCLKDKKAFAENFKHIETQSSQLESNTRFLQNTGKGFVVINPPCKPMTAKELDKSYDLPYTRMPHPKYRKRGDIPAYVMIRHSVTTHRGCFGGCSFCSICSHQGKFISSRTEASILREVENVSSMPDFGGTISDLGGPSANMFGLGGKDKTKCETCVRPSCLYPMICMNLDTDHKPMLSLYQKSLHKPKVKNVFISSGIRYDLFLDTAPKKAKLGAHREYLEQIIKKHTCGRLKVAPEHTEDEVLRTMRKPSFKLFEKFKKIFDTISANSGLEQQLIPYFISSHPACREKDMIALASKTKELGYKLEQVQDFTPLPMSAATIIYYSGIDPHTMKPVYCVQDEKGKKRQREHFFWYKK